MSIMVEGVQVALPSYEEAVCGGGGLGLSSESRVQIVLSEGQQAAGTTELLIAQAGPSTISRRSEMALVHPVPPSFTSSPSSSSCWGPEQAAAAAPSPSQRRDSTGSEQHSLPLDSEMDYSDGRPPINMSLQTGLFTHVLVDNAYMHTAY